MEYLSELDPIKKVRCRNLAPKLENITNKIQRIAKANLAKHIDKQYQKHAQNEKISDKFSIGAHVMVKSRYTGLKGKLRVKWLGPYEILKTNPFGNAFLVRRVFNINNSPPKWVNLRRLKITNHRRF